MVRYWGRSVPFPCLDGLLGYDSLAHICEDATLYNHVDGVKREFDFVLFVATPEAVQWLKQNRPRGWGKLIYCFYRSALEINRPEEIASVATFDAVCTNLNNAHTWGIFGKPVIDVLLPYAPDFDAELKRRPKENKVCLVIKRMDDIAVNYLATLAVFRKTDLKGIVSTNCAFPYHEHTEQLRSLICTLGLSDRIDVCRPRSRLEHLQSIADCKWTLSMDARQSYGRWVVDAASLGMGCVGTYSTMQDLLFRDYLVGSGDVDKAAGLFMDSDIPKVDLSIFEPTRIRAALESQLARL